jgi:2-polyprenyl-6-hydroxyphenyl methylase/3-demethylubiquinone-9 3-methyltransferase
LGATVFSFDYDIDSVNCTRYLQETFGNGNNWSVEKGSVLDKKFLKKFSHIDIVYSWGVLHHTGHMIEAFENVSSLVRNPGGILFISIYNDQGLPSRVWKKIKKRYVSSNFIIRFFLVSFSLPFLWGPRVILDFIKFGNPLKTLISYGKNNRGMSAWHDLIDWVGGFPFEVAKPEEVFDFFKTKGFQLEKLKTSQGRLGCNEFILIKKQ